MDTDVEKSNIPYQFSLITVRTMETKLLYSIAEVFQ